MFAALRVVYPVALFDYIGFALVAAVVVMQKLRQTIAAPATS